MLKNFGGFQEEEEEVIQMEKVIHCELLIK
jgi:hypothetical protein